MSATVSLSTFDEFIRRIRAGDARAAEELVRLYEPAIRLEVRMRLTDPRLYRVVDSLDICQAVLSSFFVRTALGEYDLERPDQLIRLLVAMTRNKAAMLVRHERAAKRDHRRGVTIREDAPIFAAAPSPSRDVSARELMEEVRRRMSDEELHLVELRSAGRQWSEIAAQIGGTAQGRRKQMERTAERVSRELGLEGVTLA